MVRNEPTNLPLALSSLVGREQELAQLERLVLTSRLLTLTGSGGVGKTRLALEVARRVTPEFADGAWLVELAPLTDPTLVPAAIAGSLGLVDRSGSLVDMLATFLDGHELLLVLDNCEHLIAACAQLVEELLQRCCLDLRILATSREPLRIPGEVAWRVPSLSLPPVESLAAAMSAVADVSATTDMAAVAQSEAVRLFVARSQAAAPGFALQPDNAYPIAQICRRLDGVPLAIELAAARVGVLTVDQIAGRLDDRFNLLRTNIRGAPARQQTLAAAIDWSYALLSPEEKILLRRLSVFAGGGNLEAVEAICAGTSVVRDAILDIVSHLVDKSLVLSVVSERGHETRYHLLETIRQYARERLAAAGEESTLRGGHLEYYTELAKQAEPELYRANAVAWLDRLDAEHDNFREALGWAIDRAEHAPDAELVSRAAQGALRLAGLLGHFWLVRSHLNEARTWLNKVLGLRLAQQPGAERARALASAARFAWLLDDLAGAQASSDESITIARGLGPAGRQTLAEVLLVAGNMVSSWGQASAARPLLEESLTLCRQTDSPLGVAYALRDLIMTAPIDETTAARAWLDESLAIFRAHGDIWGTARTLQVAARVSFSDGDYTSARRLFDEALAADEKLSFWPGIAAGLSELGLVSRLEGDLDRAHAYQDQAVAVKRKIGGGTQNQTLEFGYLALARGGMQEAASFFVDAAAEYSAVGDYSGTCACLTGLAQLSMIQGDPRRAARLLGSAEATLERTATQRYSRDLPDYNQQLKAVRAALDPSTLAAEWTFGRTQEPLEAIAAIPNAPWPDASRLPTPPAAAPALTPLRTLKAQWGGLTRREREIARLVAQGKSNRQIAEEIVVSERTVDHHVSSILSKLEFTSRTQVAAWAINKGLARAETS